MGVYCRTPTPLADYRLSFRQVNPMAVQRLSCARRTLLLDVLDPDPRGGECSHDSHSDTRLQVRIQSTELSRAWISVVLYVPRTCPALHSICEFPPNVGAHIRRNRRRLCQYLQVSSRYVGQERENGCERRLRIANERRADAVMLGPAAIACNRGDHASAYVDPRKYSLASCVIILGVAKKCQSK